MNDSVVVSALESPVFVRTDDLSRHAESQIRAQPDAHLIAEYAQAMIEGAEFPPVVIFRDVKGVKHLADGHHRVDAAALAALRDKTRKAQVLADVRPGSLQDALCYAMQANRLHGKRMSEADYARAIRVAFDQDLIKAVHAKDVVPEIVALTGCSIRTAQENSARQRQEMIAKRDRLIASMHREGRSQEAIGKALEVSQKAVSNVIARLSSNRDNAKTTKPKMRADEPPRADHGDPAPIEAPKAAPVAAVEKPAAYVINLSPYLPLLDRMRPLSEVDLESGAVGSLSDVSDEPPVSIADKAALSALAQIVSTLDATRRALDDLQGLRRAFGPADAIAALTAIELTTDFLGELGDYIEEGKAS